MTRKQGHLVAILPLLGKNAVTSFYSNVDRTINVLVDPILSLDACYWSGIDLAESISIGHGPRQHNNRKDYADHP